MTPLTRRDSGLCAEAASGHAQKKLNGVTTQFLLESSSRAWFDLGKPKRHFPRMSLSSGTAHAQESEIDS